MKNFACSNRLFFYTWPLLLIAGLLGISACAPKPITTSGTDAMMEMEDAGKMTVQILGSEALYPEHLELDCRDAQGERVEIDS